MEEKFKMRDIFNRLVGLKVKRDGIKELMAYLTTTDFYQAPCSRNHHLNVKGGLVTHSLNVYEAMEHMALSYDLKVDGESRALTSLFHDLCKMDYYVEGTRNVKNERTNQWEKKMVWNIKDKFPMGHGEKSLAILYRFMALTEAEALAVRWHMGPWGFSASSYSLDDAIKLTPLVGALILADQEATFFMDGKVKEKGGEKKP